MNSKREGRNSSIELLRILSTFLIVIYHFAYHGGFVYDRITASRLWLQWIRLGGNLGVDVFVLISGYFLIMDDGPTVNGKRLLRLWGPVFFYSVAIYAIFVGLGREEISLRNMLIVFLPLSFFEWWFASAYFAMYLIHPFLNRLLRGLDKRMYQGLIALGVILRSVVPTVSTQADLMDYVAWFIVLYAIAGYIRLYGLAERWTRGRCVLACLAALGVAYGLSVVCAALSGREPGLARLTFHFYNRQSILQLMGAVALFMAFAQWNLGCRRWINVLASTTFGVYLIHDNPVFRRFLWIDLFQGVKWQDTAMVIPYSIAISLAIYVVCTVIDLLRQRFVEKPFLNWLDRRERLCPKALVRFYNAVKGIVFGRDPG